MDMFLIIDAVQEHLMKFIISGKGCIKVMVPFSDNTIMPSDASRRIWEIINSFTSSPLLLL